MLIFILGNNRTTIITNIIVKSLIFGSDIICHFIRTTITRQHFNNENTFPICLFNKKTWLIIRLNQIIVSYYFPLYALNTIRIYSFYRAHSITIFLFNSDYYITTTSIIKIISKSTNSSIDRLWIPSFLKFQSVILYSFAIKQRIYIDGKLIHNLIELFL